MEVGAELFDRSAERVLAAIDGGSPARAVAQLFQVSVSYIYKALARRAATGETEARPQRNRQTLKLAAHHAAIAAEVARRPDVTLEELRAWLLATHQVVASLGLMHKTLARLGLTLKNVWPAPSARVMSDGVLACINVSGLRAQALAKMDRARRGPHKERGAEHHIFGQASTTPDRPLRHLSFTSADLVRDLGVPPAAIADQAGIPTCRQT